MHPDDFLAFGIQPNHIFIEQKPRLASPQLNLSNTFCFMAGEDPRETVRLDSPQTHWKIIKERKAALEEERKVPSDEHETLGQNEDSPKQGLSIICQLSNLCLGVCPGNAVANPLL